MTTYLTRSNTPLFNCPDLTTIFPRGKKQLLDEKEHCRALETVLFPDREITVLNDFGNQSVQVQTSDYPSKEPLYTDKRFLKELTPRSKSAPFLDKNTLISNLYELVNTPYIWGSNFPNGVEELLLYYPPERTLTPIEKTRWTFSGVDCSGLLYFVTVGYTPRNTSELYQFGDEIAFSDLRPLDLIVWKGHVIIMIADGMTIEAHERFGVRLLPLLEQVNLINECGAKFRRWYKE